MSYDLLLFKPIEGETLLDSAERVLESDTINAVDEGVFRKQVMDIAALLESIDISFTFQELGEIGSVTWLSEEFGFQIFHSNNQTSINAPYWYDGKESVTQVMNVIQRLAAFVIESTGYGLFDPQLDREISYDLADFEKHFDEAVQAYLDTMKVVKSATENSDT